MRFQFNRFEQWLLKVFTNHERICHVITTMNLIRRRQRQIRQIRQKDKVKIMRLATFGVRLQKVFNIR